MKTRRNASAAGAMGLMGMLALASCSGPATKPIVLVPHRHVPAVVSSFQPSGVSFFDAKEGLIVGNQTTRGCEAGLVACVPGIVEHTTDGGRSWTVVDEVPHPVTNVVVAGKDVAWVSVACGTLPATACNSILVTSDAGSTWQSINAPRDLTSLSPVSATQAFAIATPGGRTAPTVVTSVDAGVRWQPLVNPCTPKSFGPTNIAFANPTRGWIVCTSAPSVNLQPKAVFVTNDGGHHWLLSAIACVNPATFQPNTMPGDLPCVGYDPTADFVADGTGWMWSNRWGLEVTTDSGHTWNTLAQNVVFDDTNRVLGASLVGDDHGFLLLNKGISSPHYPELVGTKDGGKTFRTLATWPSPT